MTWHIEFFDEVSSTNDAACSRGEGYVAAARKQSAGRGQRGNTWCSEAGQNLTFSVVLEPAFLDASRQFSLCEAVSLAVAEALAEFGIEAAVKWPNDIYVGSRKIAGILIENDIRGATLGRSVVGVGLNVNQTEFPPELPNPVSMRALTGVEYSPEDVLHRVLEALDVRYAALRRGIDPEADYLRRMWRMGIPALWREPDGAIFSGTLRGVSPQGELLVELPDSRTRRFLFKEVEFVP